MTLLDPTYATKFIPIIASVSEHQATTWSSFFFDLHFLVVFTPIGLYSCFRGYTKGKLFVALFVVLSVYFACKTIPLPRYPAIPYIHVHSRDGPVAVGSRTSSLDRGWHRRFVYYQILCGFDLG